MTRSWRRIASAALLVVVACVASVFYSPRLLAFPYSAKIGRYHVYSEAPIPEPAMRAVLAEADARLATSAIDRPGDQVSVFLTQGGWRWRLLTLRASGAFGLTRGLNAAVLINRNSIGPDRVENGAAIGGVRPLSQVIAHEETHNLLRAHFGLRIDLTAPCGSAKAIATMSRAAVR